jgi:hypothetical protein
MSSIRSARRSRKVARVVAGLAVCVLVGATQAPEASAQTADTDGCVIRENFTEQAYIVSRQDRTIPGTSSGDVSVARDQLYDQGKHIGTTDVRATLYLLDDDVWQMVEGYDRFKDGSVYLLGPSSISAALRGEVIMISATGTSGAYRGKIGVRTFQLTAQAADHNTYVSNLYVCKSEDEATAKAASSARTK